MTPVDGGKRSREAWMLAGIAPADFDIRRVDDEPLLHDGWLMN